MREPQILMLDYPPSLYELINVFEEPSIPLVDLDAMLSRIFIALIAWDVGHAEILDYAQDMAYRDGLWGNHNLDQGDSELLHDLLVVLGLELRDKIESLKGYDSHGVFDYQYSHRTPGCIVLSKIPLEESGPTGSGA